MEDAPSCTEESIFDALKHYVNAQSPTSTWRRHAEICLVKGNVIHPSEVEAGESHTTSVLSSIFVIIKSAIGTSIYVLPYAFAKSGYFLGTLFLIFGCLVNIFSMHLLALCSQKVHPASFYAFARVTMPHAVALIDFSIGMMMDFSL